MAVLTLQAPLAGGGASTRLGGWFHTVWVDGPPGSGIALEKHLLIDDHGQAFELRVEPGALPFPGALRHLDRQRVSVDGELAATDDPASGETAALRATSIRLERAPGADGATATDASAVVGSRPWVTILCRFADNASTPRAPAWFAGLMGSSSPGLDHYWREVSSSNVDLAGSAVAGWYTLPQPRSYYVYPSMGMDVDLQRLLADCTGAADADVFFPSFAGIHLMFNDDLGCCAWGGSWTLVRDGQVKSYSVTWMPPWGWSNQGILAHEMGHGFGLPHSSGAYDTPYDSQWDTMSAACGAGPLDPAYGCVAPGTIAYHKDLLGWIPPSRRFAAASGTTTRITLEQLNLPPATGYLVATIPIGGSTTRFYTVEARRFAGYDAQVPAEAVVIHLVDTARERPAQVVDPDDDGDPNDAGARWLPGEVFTDPANDIAVTVEEATATGFQVTIRLGAQTAVPLKTYTVPPCRLVDTRNTAAGMIPAAGQRHFLVSGPLADPGVPSQGGAGDCQVPYPDAKGAYLNVVAVSPTGTAHLTVHPYGTAPPVASTLNFASGETVANGVLVPICDADVDACHFDLTVTMGPAAAHVVIDVSGYLRRPP